MEVIELPSHTISRDRFFRALIRSYRYHAIATFLMVVVGVIILAASSSGLQKTGTFALWGLTFLLCSGVVVPLEVSGLGRKLEKRGELTIREGWISSSEVEWVNGAGKRLHKRLAGWSSRIVSDGIVIIWFANPYLIPVYREIMAIDLEALPSDEARAELLQALKLSVPRPPGVRPTSASA